MGDIDLGARTTAGLAELERRLGVSFADRSLLEQALRHSSYINENPGLGQSNERLEFLGDAVLGLAVAERLFRDDPDATEGEMTRARAVLVREETLAGLAGSLGLGEYLRLGKGETGSGGRHKSRNLARVLEAVIGALFIDRGFEVSREFILGLLGKEFSKLKILADVDYKTRLQELVQARQQPSPVYELVSEVGLPHALTFTVMVRVGERVLGTGSGKSKKVAETEAARVAWEGRSKI
ncbi:MAG: ribonuclease III [Chloroflexota bacterium]